MATLENTVAIIFEGVDRMGAGVDSSVSKVDRLTGAVQEATQPLADVTLGIAKFEAGLVATGAAVTAFAVKLAGDFDAGFREISTLIDAPTEALDAFKAEIKAYGAESTQSLAGINQAVYNAISAGVDYADSLDVVRQAEQLAVAGKADLDQSLTVLVSSLNAYGVGMEDAEKFSDLLFQTVKSGQTTLPELGDSLAAVTGLAATAGVSFEELLAGVATLTATGSGTSEAITQIRGAISNILKPTKQASDLAAELGIEFNAAALESNGLAGVLDDVAQATGGSTEQMAVLFGDVEALNGTLTLTGLGAEKFAQNIGAMGDAAGATEAAYEKMADAVDNGTQRIQNAMQLALIGIGEPLLDEFGGIQEAIAAIFNAIGASVEGGQLEGFVTQLESMFQGIEDTLRDVASNLPEALEQADFSSFFDGIERIGEAVSNLFNGADLSSTQGLVTAIEALGSGFELLASFTAGALEAMGPFMEAVMSLAGWVADLNPEFVKWVGIVGGLATATNLVLTPLNSLVSIIGALAGRQGVVASAVPLLGRMVTALTGPVGLTVAAATAVPLIADLTASLLGLQTRAERMADAQNGLAEATRGIDATVTSWGQLNDMVESGAVVWDHATNQYVDGSKDVQTSSEAAAEALRKNQEELDVIPNRLKAIYDGLGATTGAIDENGEAWDRDAANIIDWDKAVKDALKKSGDFEESAVTLGKSLLDNAAAADDAADGWKQVGEGIFEQREAFEGINGVLDDYREKLAQGLISQEQFDAIETYASSLKDGNETASKALDTTSDAALKTEDAILKAREAANDYQVKMEEIASNERIKSLELGVDLKVAEMEADTARIEASFESLNTAITSTGETLGSLWGTLGSGDLSFSQQWDLESQLDDENKRRQEAFNLQKKLTEAQIQQMEAKTKALQSGDGMIKIDSSGLEPALETIMWQIIEKVQLRANAEGAEFLLGI